LTCFLDDKDTPLQLVCNLIWSTYLEVCSCLPGKLIQDISLPTLKKRFCGLDDRALRGKQFKAI
jgi:hypothetical protein